MSKVVSSLDELSAEQRSAFSNFRQQHPRNWKSKLLDGWMRAAYPGLLQQIRNSLGPEWLSKVKESDFIPVIDAPSKVLAEKASVLGFASVDEMNNHHAWLEGEKDRHAMVMAYQQTDEARRRVAAASEAFGISVASFVHVEPLEIDDDNEEHRSSCRP